MGILLTPGAADPNVQALAAKAQGGDKTAQYELGRWFEASRDPHALTKAIKLYRIAAMPQGGTRLIFMPRSSGISSSVVSMGQKIEANHDAKGRLHHLEIQYKQRVYKGEENKKSTQIRWYAATAIPFRGQKIKWDRSCPHEIVNITSCVIINKPSYKDGYATSFGDIIVDIGGDLKCSDGFCEFGNKYMVEKPCRMNELCIVHFGIAIKNNKLFGFLYINNNIDGTRIDTVGDDEFLEYMNKVRN